MFNFLNSIIFILSCILTVILLICMYIVCIGIYGSLLILFVFRKEIIGRINTLFGTIKKRIKSLIIGQ
jgi:hypothetical protein